MIRVRTGNVLSIDGREAGVTRLTVLVDGERAPAVNYDDLTGAVAEGDKVLLNTTAVHLDLGTGGMHFVMGVVGRETEYEGTGHIVKCRYTPVQATVLAVEEPASPHHDALKDGELDGVPVLVATLHSMVPAAAAVLKAERPHASVVYVMTDGAALPAQWSRLLGHMKRTGLVDAVITAGHAFGGDYEAVTIYSALLAAKRVCAADFVIVAMGPGVVGTGTTWGTTALEQGTILDAVAIMSGRPIAAPRVSLADPRERHQGISHHALTALGRIAARPCEVALPNLPNPHRERILAQLASAGIAAKHRVKEYEADLVLDLLAKLDFDVRTMGRTPHEDPGPFLSAGAAALCALEE